MNFFLNIGCLNFKYFFGVGGWGYTFLKILDIEKNIYHQKYIFNLAYHTNNLVNL